MLFPFWFKKNKQNTLTVNKSFRADEKLIIAYLHSIFLRDVEHVESLNKHIDQFFCDPAGNEWPPEMCFMSRLWGHIIGTLVHTWRG